MNSSVSYQFVFVDIFEKSHLIFANYRLDWFIFAHVFDTRLSQDLDSGHWRNFSVYIFNNHNEKTSDLEIIFFGKEGFIDGKLVYFFSADPS